MKLAHRSEVTLPGEQAGGSVLGLTSPLIRLTPSLASRPLSTAEDRLGASDNAVRLAARLAAGLAESEQIVLFSGISREANSAAVAVQVALGLSRLNRGPVLLVDASLHNPVLHELINAPRTPGLSELLLHKVGLPEAVQPLAGGRMSFLPAGGGSSDVLSLLPGLATLLDFWRKQFCWIIVSGPVLFSAEASSLARLADGSVIVAASGKHRKETLVQVKQELDSLRAKLLGVVLSQEKATPGARHKREWPDGKMLDRVLPIAILCVAFAIGYLWNSGSQARRVRADTPVKNPLPRMTVELPSTRFAEAGANASSVRGAEPAFSASHETKTVPPLAEIAEARGSTAVGKPKAAITLAAINPRLDLHGTSRTAIVIQVAAMPGEPAATALAGTLLKDKFRAFVTPAEGSPYYRVLVGPFEDVTMAEKAKRELQAQGFETLVRPWLMPPGSISRQDSR